MFRAAIGWLVLGAVGALVVSCSLTTDTRGLAGRPRDASVDVEIGTPPADAASPDAPLADAACASGFLTCEVGGACATDARDKRNCGACGLVCDQCVAGACHACATAEENLPLELACPSGTVVREILFSSYGTPIGSCGAFVKDPSCDAPTSATHVADRCMGQRSCTLRADNGEFSDPCSGTLKRLYVEVRCAP